MLHGNAADIKPRPAAPLLTKEGWHPLRLTWWFSGTAECGVWTAELFEFPAKFRAPHSAVRTWENHPTAETPAPLLRKAGSRSPPLRALFSEQCLLCPDPLP